jgi:hypothetical protein
MTTRIGLSSDPHATPPPLAEALTVEGGSPYMVHAARRRRRVYFSPNITGR